MEDTVPASSYTIRPNFKHKFRPTVAKDLIHKVLSEFFMEKQYIAEQVEGWTKTLSDSIKDKMKGLSLDRYKYVVQVVIGEQRGEGIKIGSRCLWDTDTDNYVQDVYMNDSLFCLAVAYGIYYY